MNFTAKEYKQIRDCIKILDKKPIKATDILLMNKLLDTEYLYFELPETGEVYIGIGENKVRSCINHIGLQQKFLEEPLNHLMGKMYRQVQEDINEAYYSENWEEIYKKYEISLKIQRFSKYSRKEDLQDIFCLPATSLPDESIFTFIDNIGSSIYFWHIRAFGSEVNKVVCDREALKEELMNILIDFFEVKQYE